MTTENNHTNWKIDAGHSQVLFKIKHLGITNVNGTFDSFQGNVNSEGEDFNGARVHFEIETSSLNTKHNDRDNHLKSPELFDVIQFPKIYFDGHLFQKSGTDYELRGDLTILSTTKTLALETSLTGIGKGRFNDTRVGFEVNGKINRKDFGLTWNILSGSGDFVVGEEVKLQFDIQLIKQEVVEAVAAA